MSNNQQPRPAQGRPAEVRSIVSGSSTGHPSVRVKMSKESHVIVVGAGISGLCAAKLLSESGLNVTVLEARDRVGGRTYTKKSPDVGYVDLGGSYMGMTQYRLQRIIKELGIENYKVNEKENLIHFKNGCGSFFAPTSVPSSWNPLRCLDLNNLVRTIDEMGKEIPADAPWDAPHAEEWDNMTVKEFMNKTCWTSASKGILYAINTLAVTSEPYESSLLWFLWYVKLGGGVVRIMSTTNGGQERKMVGGTQQISERIAEKLAGKVHLKKPVVAIQQTETGVKVTALDGTQYEGQYVIFAMTPCLQAKIHYDPPLPLLRNQLIQRAPMGSVMKCILYYKTPFWRGLGCCGSMLIEGDDSHPVCFTLDDTKPDGSFPALVGFCVADKLRRSCNMTKEERKRRLCKSYAKVLRSDEALKPIHYEEYNWMGEQYSGGCYTAMFPPGFLTVFGKALREPVGRLHFAGTETANYWPGYIEGGIQAGERAAREILALEGKVSRSLVWQDEPRPADVTVVSLDPTFWERHLPSVPGLLKFVFASSALSAAAVLALFYVPKSRFKF